MTTKYVLLYCTILYTMGIFVASSTASWYYVLAVFLFIGIILPYQLIKEKAGVWLCIAFYLFFAFGVFNTIHAMKEGYKLIGYANEKQMITGIVTDVEKTKPYTVLTFHIHTINSSKADGKLSLIIENAQKSYQYGDELSFISLIGMPKPPKYEGGFDSRISLFSRGKHGSVYLKESSIEYLGNHRKINDLNAWGFTIRDKMKETTYRILPPDQAGLLIAIMFGDTSNVTDALMQQSKMAGITHTMATSGLHVSIMLMAFTFMISKISRHYQVSAAIGIVILVLFYYIMGYSPSISRAILMALLTLVAYFFNRRGEGFTTLAFSALVILIVYPFALFDIGFILSFASVLGIIAIGNRAQKKFPLLKEKIINAVLLTVSALIGTSIFTAYYFGSLTLFGAISNLIAVPLVGLLLPLGYLAGLLGWICLPIGKMLAYSLYVLLLLFERTAEWGASIPIASISVARPNLGIVIIYFGLCYLLFSFVSYGGRKNA